MKSNKIILIAVVIIFALFSGCEDCRVFGLRTGELPLATFGTHYEVRLAVDHECDPLLEEYFILGGTLPPGMGLSRFGYIEGVAAARGNFYFTIGVEVCYNADGLAYYYDCYDLAQGYVITVE